MCCREYAGVLHMVLQVPELPQADTLNVDNIGRIRHWDFWPRPFQSRHKWQDEIQ